MCTFPLYASLRSTYPLARSTVAALPPRFPRWPHRSRQIGDTPLSRVEADSLHAPRSGHLCVPPHFYPRVYGGSLISPAPNPDPSVTATPPPPPQFLRLHRLRRVLLPLSSSRQHPSPPGRREIADAHRPARRFRRRKIPPTLPICPTREHSRRHDHPLRQRPGRPGGLGLLRPLPRLHLLPLLLPLPCPEPGARTPGLRGG